MPANRLPWFKVWAEAIDHEKIAQLNDALFRTWITMLARASQQPTRWRFASTKHAATVTGRPVSHMKALVAAGLLDVADDGVVWVHDWKQWQDRYPSDLDRSPSNGGLPPDGSPEHSANGALKTPRTLRKRSPDHSAEDSAKPLYKKREERRESKDEEYEEDDSPSAASQPSPTGESAAADFGADEQSRIDATLVVLAPIGLEGDPRFWRKVLDAYGTVDLEAEAFKMADWLKHHKKRSCSTRFVLSWLDRAAHEAPHAPTPRITRQAPTDLSAFRKYA